MIQFTYQGNIVRQPRTTPYQDIKNGRANKQSILNICYAELKLNQSVINYSELQSPSMDGAERTFNEVLHFLHVHVLRPPVMPLYAYTLGYFPAPVNPQNKNQIALSQGPNPRTSALNLQIKLPSQY